MMEHSEPARIACVSRGAPRPDRTDIHNMTIGGVPVTIVAECLSGRNRPYGLYTLRMTATYADESSDDSESESSSESDRPAKIFVFHAHAKRAPADNPESDWPKDEFVCVADALDMDEIPPDEADIRGGVPYYRSSTLELCFRNSDRMYECRDAIFECGS